MSASKLASIHVSQHKGQNFNFPTQKMTDPFVLHQCCKFGTTDDLANLIIKGAANPQSINIQDDEGDTPLHKALRNGASDENIMKLIDVAYNSTNNSTTSLNSETKDYHNEEESSFTTSEFKSCLSLCDEDGECPLHVAIKHSASIEVIQYLLSAYPQAIFISNFNDESPLHTAIEHGRKDAMFAIIHSHACEGCMDIVLGKTDSTGLAPLFVLWNIFKELEGDETNFEEVKNNRYDDEHFMDNDTAAAAATDVLRTFEMLVMGTKSVNYFPSYTLIGCSNNETEALKRPYSLLRRSINLGENIVPEEYVLFLMKTYPHILQMVDERGRLPIHYAATNPNPERPSEQCTTAMAAPMVRTPSLSSFHFSEISTNSKMYHDLYLHHQHPISHSVESQPGDKQKENVFQGPSIIPSFLLPRSFLEHIAKAYPEGMTVRDEEGSLPLHLAIRACPSWGTTLNVFTEEAPQTMRSFERKTNLPPFLLAASSVSKGCNDTSQPRSRTTQGLELVYHLLLRTPDLIEASASRHHDHSLSQKFMSSIQKNIKRKQPEVSQNKTQSYKRRRIQYNEK